MCCHHCKKINQQAHQKAVSAIDFSRYVPGLLATASTDHAVKIWDLANPSGTGAATAGSGSGDLKPRIVVSKNMNVGPLFSLRFFPQKPFLLGTAGEEGMVAIWECLDDPHVTRCFGGASRVLESPPSFPTREAGAKPAVSAGTGNLSGGGGGGSGGNRKSKKKGKGKKKKK